MTQIVQKNALSKCHWGQTTRIILAHQAMPFLATQHPTTLAVALSIPRTDFSFYRFHPATLSPQLALRKEIAHRTLTLPMSSGYLLPMSLGHTFESVVNLWDLLQGSTSPSEFFPLHRSRLIITPENAQKIAITPTGIPVCTTCSAERCSRKITIGTSKSHAKPTLRIEIIKIRRNRAIKKCFLSSGIFLLLRIKKEEAIVKIFNNA
ncbi:hypothetical protein J3R74_001295 [Puniceicoccus vermicola]